ncbi:hypothetical protein K0U27_06900 [archaeon]|nr:hypothetical protein [archaeon]
MSHSDPYGIRYRTCSSTMWGDPSSLHVQTAMGLGHRCWSDKERASLSDACIIPCNKGSGGNSR